MRSVGTYLCLCFCKWYVRFTVVIVVSFPPLSVTSLFYRAGTNPIKNVECRGGKVQEHGQEVWAKLPCRGASRSEYIRGKSQKYANGIIYNGAAKNHTAVLNIGAQEATIGMGGWKIIKHHDS